MPPGEGGIFTFANGHKGVGYRAPGSCWVFWIFVTFSTRFYPRDEPSRRKELSIVGKDASLWVQTQSLIAPSGPSPSMVVRKNSTFSALVNVSKPNIRIVFIFFLRSWRKGKKLKKGFSLGPKGTFFCRKNNENGHCSENKFSLLKEFCFASLI